jgi:hypothetical protein
MIALYPQRINIEVKKRDIEIIRLLKQSTPLMIKSGCSFLRLLFNRLQITGTVNTHPEIPSINP